MASFEIFIGASTSSLKSPCLNVSFDLLIPLIGCEFGKPLGETPKLGFR